MRALVIGSVLVGSTTAHAERPDAWLFRATPGFGYSWDVPVRRCGIEGPMTVGSWFVGKFVTPSLNVGGALSATVGGMKNPGCMLDDGAGMLAVGMIVGPSLVWYPSDRGFHVTAHAGFATFDQNSVISSYGVGSTVAVGYDWAEGHIDGNAGRWGLALQATGTRMTGGHAMIVPALVMTVGVD